MSMLLSHFVPPCPQVCSLHLCLYSCPAARFISTDFLDSIYAGTVSYKHFACTMLFNSHYNSIRLVLQLTLEQCVGYGS